MIHPKHLHPRRYVFHGHASGVAAHIRRPEDVFLDVKSSVALPVIGGRVQSSEGPTTLDKWVSFDSATSSAQGDYISAADGKATTLGDLAFDAAATETRVSAQVRGLAILGRVHIANLSLGLISRSAQGTAQPPIRLEGNRIEGIRIDDARLKIELAEGFFTEHDTKDKLKTVHGKGLPHHHSRLFLPCKVGEEEVTTFPEADGTVKCTIVQSLEWDGPKHKDAQIHGHVVVVPNFGKIYFGELFVTGNARRLTLVRFQLGSDDGGEVAAGDGQTNGQTWP